MAMTIQDDMWEACQMLPAKQQAPFLHAVVSYGFDGKEPEGKPPWLPLFVVIRDRIKMSAAASERGRQMAAARWGKQDAQACTQAYAQADATAHAQAYAQDMHEQDAESENEIEEEIPPYSPPYALQCLAALNETLGTTYASLPSKAARTLTRFEEKYALADVRAMIAYKRDEWQDTQFARNLTPGTLFGPDHFETYIQQSMMSREEDVSYDYNGDAIEL